MERYLTLDECAIELRVTPQTVKQLLNKKLLTGIQISPTHWRILDPSPGLRQQLLEPRLERFPFISPHEAAEVLGMTDVNMKWHMDVGKAKPERIEGGPHYKVFTPKELRRLAALREKRKGPGRLVYSPTIVRWLRGYLDQDANVAAGALQEMLDGAVKLPEPEKSKTVVEIWALIDKLQELVGDRGVEPR